MPMMHAEDLAIQEASLPLFEKYTNADLTIMPSGTGISSRDLAVSRTAAPFSDVR